MSDRSNLINRLLNERDFRADYIRAKLDVLIPSQLRALRLRRDKTQSELAQLADMKQARISAMETPGKVNFNVDTLVRIAATLNAGLMIKLIPFSEMLGWENSYSQDNFNVTQLADDIDFLQPAVSTIRRRTRRKRSSQRSMSAVAGFQMPSASGASTNPIPIQQERAKQLKLPFDVIVLPKPNVANDLPLRAAAGAGGNYANR
jgi:transcriptional regulator with XRE-family HTH domain